MTLIELHVPDFEAAKKFYNRIGFEVVWERPPEGFKGYLVMRWGENTLCFWGGNQEIHQHPYFGNNPATTIRGQGVEIVLCHPDYERLYAHIEGEAFIVEPMKLQPWGLRDFRLVDPFGFYLRITAPHNIHDRVYAVP